MHKMDTVKLQRLAKPTPDHKKLFITENRDFGQYIQRTVRASPPYVSMYYVQCLCV